MTRIESPSSINLYKQCARKYYFRYIKRVPSPPNIYMVRGNVVHSVLENIYDLDLSTLTFENFEGVFKNKLQELTVQFWKEKQELIREFALTDEELSMFFDQAIMMALNWFELFKYRLNLHIDKGFESAFEIVRPVREKKYISQYHGVQGFIDAIEHVGDETRIIDYKTTANATMTEAYRLQLAIYALMYHEEHGKMPDKVGIYFIGSEGVTEKLLEVGQEMLDFAKTEIEEIKEKTVTKEINDYPKTEDYNMKCKWSKGQCEFFEMCHGQQDLSQYDKGFEPVSKFLVSEKDFGVH